MTDSPASLTTWSMALTF